MKRVVVQVELEVESWLDRTVVKDALLGMRIDGGYHVIGITLLPRREMVRALICDECGEVARAEDGPLLVTAGTGHDRHDCGGVWRQE